MYFSKGHTKKKLEHHINQVFELTSLSDLDLFSNQIIEFLENFISQNQKNNP